MKRRAFLSSLVALPVVASVQDSWMAWGREAATKASAAPTRFYTWADEIVAGIRAYEAWKKSLRVVRTEDGRTVITSDPVVTALWVWPDR